MTIHPKKPPQNFHGFALDAGKMLRALWISGGSVSAIFSSGFVISYQISSAAWISTLSLAMTASGFTMLAVAAKLTQIWRKHLREEFSLRP